MAIDLRAMQKQVDEDDDKVVLNVLVCKETAMVTGGQDNVASRVRCDERCSWITAMDADGHCCGADGLGGERGSGRLTPFCSIICWLSIVDLGRE